MSFPYLLSDKTLTVIIDSRSYQTDRSNPHWDKIKEGLTNDSTTGEEMIGLLKPINAIANALSHNARVTILGGTVYVDNEPIHSALSVRILDIIAEGLNPDPWVKFAENVYANPYEWSREELYLFLEKADLPITPDGCFIAYKRVRSDYKDIHSGTIDNSIGQLVVMPGGRESVDPDRFRTCSYGLHFCSKDYLPHFGAGSGNKVVLVKINPADVVSIPADYDNTKGRAWRYEVVGEIPYEEIKSYNWSAISDSYGDYSWDDSVDGDPGADWVGEEDEPFETVDSDGYVEVNGVWYCPKGSCGPCDSDYWAIHNAFVADVTSHMGVVDPEFEKLLAEEEEIERATRAAHSSIRIGDFVRVKDDNWNPNNIYQVTDIDLNEYSWMKDRFHNPLQAAITVVSRDTGFHGESTFANLSRLVLI